MSDYIAYLEEVFERLGTIHARKMFGGYGIYFEDVMFALVADETLYLKTDAENVGYFEKEELEPFEYDKNGKVMKMSYYQAPDEVMENKEAAATWAKRSIDAARRSQLAKKKKSLRK